jgi:hypothetical protein
MADMDFSGFSKDWNDRLFSPSTIQRNETPVPEKIVHPMIVLYDFLNKCVGVFTT